MLDFIWYDYIPFLIVPIDLVRIYLISNKRSAGWLLSVLICIVFLVWIFASKNYGFLPMTTLHLGINYHSYKKWRKEEK